MQWSSWSSHDFSSIIISTCHLLQETKTTNPSFKKTNWIELAGWLVPLPCSCHHKVLELRLLLIRLYTQHLQLTPQNNNINHCSESIRGSPEKKKKLMLCLSLFWIMHLIDHKRSLGPVKCKITKDTPLKLLYQFHVERLCVC